MKQFIISLLFIFLFSSCEKGSDERNKEFTFYAQISTPAGLNTLDAHYFTIQEIRTFYLTTLNSAGIDPNLVIKVVPKKCFIYSRIGSVNFQFIQNISLRMYNSDNPLDKPECFYFNQVKNQDNSSITLIPTVFDAKKILANEIVNLEMRQFLYESPITTNDYEIKLVFAVYY